MKQMIKCEDCGKWIEAKTSKELVRKFEAHKKNHQRENQGLK